MPTGSVGKLSQKLHNVLTKSRLNITQEVIGGNGISLDGNRATTIHERTSSFIAYYFILSTTNCSGRKDNKLTAKFFEHLGLRCYRTNMVRREPY